MNLNKIRAFNSDFDVHVSREENNKLRVDIRKDGQSVMSKLVSGGQSIRVSL